MKEKISTDLLWSFLLAACIILLVVACTEDNPVENTGTRVALNLSAGISTRATDATWSKGDAIGIFTVATGTNAVVEGQANFKYINSAEEGVSATFSAADAANTAYYPTAGAEVDVLAYYPYSAANSQLSTLNSQLPINVADQSNLPAIDLMAAERVVSKSSKDPDVALAFTHQLTKLVVSIAKGAGAEAIDLSAAKLILTGTPATATFDLASQTLTPASTKADIPLSLSEGASAVAIVIPTAAGSGVGFTVQADGKTFEAPLPATTALKSGDEVTVKITIKQSQVADVTATIKPWTGGPEIGMEAINIEMPTNPNAGTPEVTTFKLWKNNDETDARTYTLDENKKWVATPAPFYLEDIKAGDKLNARHTPVDDAADDITKVKDVLEAGPIELKDKAIALEFRHINAQLKVNLSKGSTLPKELDLTKAEVKIYGYELSGATNTIIVEPGTIAAGKVAEITVGGKTYTANTTKAIELKAGTTNTLNLTLKVEEAATAVGLAVSMHQWEVDTQTDLTAISFNMPEHPESGTPEITKFTLYKNYDTANEMAVEYTYNTNTKSWVASPEPYYKEDIDATDLFYGEYIPEEIDPETNLSDILDTDEVAMDDKGMIALEFKHVFAQLQFVMADTSIKDASIQILDFTFVAGQEYLFHSLSKNNLSIVVTAGDKAYTGVINKLTLEAGRKTVITITLKTDETNILGITVKGAKWGEDIKVNAEFIEFLKEFDFSKLPGAGSVELSIDYQAIGWYEWDGTKITDSTEDFDWLEQDKTQKYTFQLIFYPENSNDILEATLTDVSWGTKLVFGEFTHVNARLIVKLIPGEGYDASETFDEAKILFTRDGGYSYLEMPHNELIIEPQGVDDGFFLILELNEMSYYLSLKGMFPDDKFEANKTYIVNATLKKVATGITIGTVADWNTWIVTGSGNFEY